MISDNKERRAVRKVSKVLAMTLLAATIMVLMIGCSKKDDPIVAVIEGKKITESLYRTYLWSTQQFFEQLSGKTIWEMELDGRKTEDIAKERALESAVLSVVTAKKAEELKIELTKEEKKLAHENAKSFMSANEELAKTYGFNEKAVEQLLISTALSEKVQMKLSENYLPNDSEIQTYISEYKSSYEKVRIKQILLSLKGENNQAIPKSDKEDKKALAEKLLKRLKDGEAIEELITAYSEDPELKQTKGEYTFARNVMAQELEEVAFNTKAGEIYPKVIESVYAYHIIKVEEHIPADEEKMKQDYVEKSKVEFANSEFEEMIKNASIEKTEFYESLMIVKDDVQESTQQDGKENKEVK